MRSFEVLERGEGAGLGPTAAGSGRLDIFRRKRREKARQFRMFHDDRGLALNSGEIAALKLVAGFRGNEHLSGQMRGLQGISFRHGSFGIGRERFVNAHDKFRNIVQPRELCMVNDQPEELAGIYLAVDAFVIAALHIEQRFVNAQKNSAQRQELLARVCIIQW
jgi:hypothetical protein